MVEAVAADGLDYPLQAALHGRRVLYTAPGSAGTVTRFGIAATLTATVSHPALSNSATLAERLHRTRFQTSTTAGNSRGVADAVSSVRRGAAAGTGGFYLHTRFCSGNIALAGAQVFVGLTSTGGFSGEPSTFGDKVAVIKDAGHTTWRIAHSFQTLPATIIDTGEPYVANRVYDLIMFARPNWDRVAVKFRRREANGTSVILYDGELTTNLPEAATFIMRRVAVRNGTTAAAANVEFVSSYLESDI
jgi:hypothetical protein